MSNKWIYSGDLNLEYGGLYWREDDAEDYVLAVEITPASDASGPDNLYLIEVGSIYLPTDIESRVSALSVIGESPETATRRDIVEAFRAYHGIEAHESWIVRIGKPEEHKPGSFLTKREPDKVLRAGSSLRRYVENNHLN